jgi:uroporphyrinogen-III synthase
MVLSTKLLTPTQQGLAQRLGLVVEDVSLLKVELTGEAAASAWSQSYDGWVMSSQQAMRALIGRLPAEPQHRPVAAVGAKTAQALRQAGLSVALQADHALALAQAIETAAWGRVAFFCGNQRRDELPEYLLARGVQVDEYVVYHSQPQPQPLGLTRYQAVLLFSPSGVRALLATNPWPPGLSAVAIGATTAAAFEAATGQRARYPAAPSVEAVLRLAAALSTS